MSQALIGTKLGSFRLDEIVGAGAMGVVFRATHEPKGRPVALKLVHDELLEKGKVFDRFEREAKILQQFNHPNIVRWIAWGRYKGTYYFAMEFVEGETLDKVLQERGELPWREVVGMAIELCDALHYAHERSVVHRDLKPSNLMVTREGKLKLTDFGIAKHLERTALTAPGRTLGTAAYMAPEQIRGTPAVSHKTDLYSLGALLYQMLTGKPPFEGASAVILMHSHLNAPPPHPGEKVQELPRELDELVVKLMAKSPTDRPWDAEAVAQTLRSLRERAERGDKIAMVWPSADSPAANPARAGMQPAGAPAPTRKKAKKGRKSRTLAGVNSGFATREENGGMASRLLDRAVLETLGLVAALLAIGGFIGYWLWPPSAGYLYHQAEPLMASPHRSDWLTAREEYLDPLDRRFPDHPYKEQLRKWRDQILLDEAESRSKNLSSPVKTAFSEPQNNGERQYVSFDTLAQKAASRGDELMAMNYWKEMARVLKPDDREDRKWYLLAVRRADELETRIRERQEFVADQLQRAENAIRAGRPNEAVAIRSMLVEKYGHYTDLAGVLGTAAVAPSAEQPPAPRPAPPGATPESGSAPPPPKAERPRDEPEGKSQPEAATVRAPEAGR
jgi:serine/threonine-protein kinase